MHCKIHKAALKHLKKGETMHLSVKAALMTGYDVRIRFIEGADWNTFLE
jgi:hypothetical protein